MFLRFSHREAEKYRHCTGQAGNLFEQPCQTSTVTHQKATELENVHVTSLEKVTNTSHHTEPSTLRLEINIVKKVLVITCLFVKFGKNLPSSLF